MNLVIVRREILCSDWDLPRLPSLNKYHYKEFSHGTLWWTPIYALIKVSRCPILSYQSRVRKRLTAAIDMESRVVGHFDILFKFRATIQAVRVIYRFNRRSI